jgi:hypothetical protein
MPRIQNFTMFPNFRYYSADNKGADFGVVIVKATFELMPSGRLVVADEQAPMLFDDECHGKPNESSLWHPSDLVPHKPNTDLIVNATARAPGNKPTSSWRCGIGIDDSTGKVLLLKPLRVTGPRRWIPRWRRDLTDEEKREWRKHRSDFDKWELSQPEPVAELPIRYEFAFGGSKPIGEDESGKIVRDSDPRNPLGCAAIDRDWSDHTQAHIAPQIEDPKNPIADPYKAYAPESLGAIPPAWEPRLPLGGAYDDHWQKNIWPEWPPDYSFAYHNSAHPGLICDGYLAGDERISMVGFFRERTNLACWLPGTRIRLDWFGDNNTFSQTFMNLDTLFVDVNTTRPRDYRVILVWRTRFAPDRFHTVQIHDETPRLPAKTIRRNIQKRRSA